MNLTPIYEHFRADERTWIDQYSEWLERCSATHGQRETDFLDPRQAYILNTLAAKVDNVQVLFYGGYEEAERKKALIAPDYAYLENADLQLALLEVNSSDPAFTSLRHGDFLGAVLGLGIKREKIGDIHYTGERCYIFVAAEMADYLHLQLQQVHRVHVQTAIIPISQFVQVEQSFIERQISVASLRLDGIASDAVRLSRAKIVAPIKSGKCKVNWMVVEDPAYQIQLGDVISLKGFGRFKMIDIQENAKSGRYRVKIALYE